MSLQVGLFHSFLRTEQYFVVYIYTTSSSSTQLSMDIQAGTSLFECPKGICRRRQWHPTPVLLPRKSHGQRSLVGCSPWGRQESDMTEQLHFHSSLSCIGEGHGNPLQCSCLENPRDRGTWWAAVYGAAQSRTRLKRLSSSSSSSSRTAIVLKTHKNHSRQESGEIGNFILVGI